MRSIEDAAYVLVYGDEGLCSGCCCSRTADEEMDRKWRKHFKRKMEKASLEVEDIVNPEDTNQHFVLISASFDVLAKQAELLRLKIPLADKVQQEENNFFIRWMPCCSRTLTKRILAFIDSTFGADKLEDDYVARKFVYKDYHLYKGSSEPRTFFRSSLRSLLVHNILIELDITDEEMEEIRLKSAPHSAYCGHEEVKRGLLYLRREGIYTADFPLHDPSELDRRPLLCSSSKTSPPPPPPPLLKGESESVTADSLIGEKDERLPLYNAWFRCPAWFKYQPFSLIRDYFGEKIAFYFAWCGHLVMSLWIPALVGIGVFGYGLHLSIQRYSSQAAITTTASTNLAATTESLTEIEKVLASSAAALENALAVIRESFDNEVTPYFALLICLWGTIFTETWRRRSARLSYEWDVNKYEKNERDHPDFRKGERSKRRPAAVDHRVEVISFSTELDADDAVANLEPDAAAAAAVESQTNWHKFGRFAISFLVLFIMIGAACLSVAGVIIFRIFATVDWFSTPQSEKVRFLVASILPPIMNAVSSVVLQMGYNRLAIALTRWENHRKLTDYDDALILKVFGFQFVNCYSSLFYIAFFQSIKYENGIFGIGERYIDACGTDENCMSILSFQLLVMMIVKPFAKFANDILLPLGIRLYRRCRGRNKSRPVDESDDRRATYIAGELRKDDLTQLDDFTIFEYAEKVIQFGYVMLFAASFPLAPLMALITDIFDIRVDAWRLLRLYRRPVGYIIEDIGMWEKIISFLSIAGVATNAFLIAFTSQWGQKQTGNNQFWIIIGFQNICICLKLLLEFFIADVPSQLKTRMAHEKRWMKWKVKKFRQNSEKFKTNRMRSYASTVTEFSQKIESKDAENNPLLGMPDAAEVTVKAEPNGDDGLTVGPRQRTPAKKTNKKEQTPGDDVPPLK